MTEKLAELRKEVNGLYRQRINDELTEKQLDEYFEKDRLLQGLCRANHKN